MRNKRIQSGTLFLEVNLFAITGQRLNVARGIAFALQHRPCLRDLRERVVYLHRSVGPRRNGAPLKVFAPI